MRKLISSMATVFMIICLSGTADAGSDVGVVKTAVELQTIEKSQKAIAEHQTNQKELWADKIDPLIAQITDMTTKWGYNYCGGGSREYSEAAYQRYVQCLESLQSQSMASEERIVQYQTEVISHRNAEEAAAVERVAKIDAWLPPE